MDFPLWIFFMLKFYCMIRVLLLPFGQGFRLKMNNGVCSLALLSSFSKPSDFLQPATKIIIKDQHGDSKYWHIPVSKTHPSHHIFSFQKKSHQYWREDDIPVQSLSLLTLTPLFLRPLMLWKPVHWLLSNCLSFRLCPCPGLSVQTHPPARGDAGNARSRSKADICSKAEDPQVQRLMDISETGSLAHVRNPNLVNGNI